MTSLPDKPAVAQRKRSPFFILLLLSLGIFFVWRIVTVSLAEYYAGPLNRAAQNSARALAWHPKHPKALFAVADSALLPSQEKAEQNIRQALRGNPANGEFLAALAVLLQAEDHFESADQAMTLASKMYPEHPAVNQKAAAYWLNQGQYERMMMHWQQALRGRPWLESSLFPVLLSLLESPEIRESFAYLTTPAAKWWPRFFEYVSHEGSLRAVHTLYRLRPAEALRNKEVISAYINRLQREDQWSNAYLAWAQQLANNDLKWLGYLYNGDFEADFLQQGFGWHVPERGGVSVKNEKGRAQHGKRMLAIVFRGLSAHSELLFQPLQLSPGKYRIKGHSKSAGILGSGVLYWSVWCAKPSARELGRSDPIWGVHNWRTFSVDLLVPSEGCNGQVIQLGAEGLRSSETQNLGQSQIQDRIHGSIWFDNLTILRIGDI